MLYLVVRAICKYVFRIVLGMFGGIRVEGLGYVPRQGALLVAPNHQSDGDPIVVGVALPRPAYFMAKSELFEIRVLGPAIRFLHAFPVRRGKPDRQALHRAEDLLKSGAAVVIFPEGLTSEDGTIQELNPGVIMIAMRSGAPILPVGLIGTNRILPYGEFRPRYVTEPVVVKFGRPIAID